MCELCSGCSAVVCAFLVLILVCSNRLFCTFSGLKAWDNSVPSKTRTCGTRGPRCSNVSSVYGAVLDGWGVMKSSLLIGQDHYRPCLPSGVREIKGRIMGHDSLLYAVQ